MIDEKLPWVLEEIISPRQRYALLILIKASGILFRENGYSIENWGDGGIYLGWADIAKCLVLQRGVYSRDQRITYDQVIEYLKSKISECSVGEL